MSRGISNFEIEKIFKDINSEDIDDNFLNVFPSNKINKFLMFEKTIPEKKNPFIISNTEGEDQPDTH